MSKYLIAILVFVIALTACRPATEPGPATQAPTTEPTIIPATPESKDTFAYYERKGDPGPDALSNDKVTFYRLDLETDFDSLPTETRFVYISEGKACAYWVSDDAEFFKSFLKFNDGGTVYTYYIVGDEKEADGILAKWCES